MWVGVVRVCMCVGVGVYVCGCPVRWARGMFFAVTIYIIDF